MSGVPSVSNKPKSKKALRRQKEKEPKLVENPKQAMFIKGNKCSQICRDLLNDLHSIKKPLAVKYSRKNPILPFEDPTSIEFFSNKTDSSLFCFTNHTKKRPNNMVFGRLFDFHVADMFEVGIQNYESITECAAKKRPYVGNKPCFIFNGDFERSIELSRFANLLLDFFRGRVVDKINLKGIEHVICVTAEEDLIHFRHYSVVMKKSGTRIPRIELEDCGPNFDMKMRRFQLASEDVMKESCRVPKQLIKKKVKSVKSNVFGEKIATIHMQRQDLNTLQTSHVKALSRKGKRKYADAEDDNNNNNNNNNNNEVTSPPPKKKRKTK